MGAVELAIDASLEADALIESWRITSRRWVPHSPSARQKLFLEELHDEPEAFYGGAAGGGKSDALLAAALEYVDTPGYASLLLRRTYQDLAKPGALMDRAHDWLANTGARWNEQKKQWRFPSDALLTFGYLETENDKFQYQSAEYQFIGFDELTQFTESQYTYLFSRLRRLAGVNIPLRMRAGSNPAEDPSGYWVAERFVPDDFTPDDALQPVVVWKASIDGAGRPVSRPFVPARLEDNPFLDQAAYEESLDQLDAVTRAQLRTGDWRIRKRGNIYPMWDEDYHIITWGQFKAIYGVAHIPEHWQIGVSQDWGFTDLHPCVTTWMATAAANAPLKGSVFIYRGLTTHGKTAAQIADDYLLPLMKEHGEQARCSKWLMSHEAASERKTYNEKGLGFRSWSLDVNGGIEQVRRYLDIRDKDKPHPFGSTNQYKHILNGRPSLYLVVDSSQRYNPRDDAGLARHRGEFSAYKYKSAKAGDPLAKDRPHDLFNDAMDTVRCYAAENFPYMTPLTAAERTNKRLVDLGFKPGQVQESPYTEMALNMKAQKIMMEETRPLRYGLGQEESLDDDYIDGPARGF